MIVRYLIKTHVPHSRLGIGWIKMIQKIEKYTFIGIDEGCQQIFLGDTSGTIYWCTDLSMYPLARSLQNLGDGRVLVGYDRGYFIVDTEGGSILHQCERWDNITSATRNSDGYTLITGLDIGGSPGIWVLSLDGDDQVIESVRRRGSYVRVMKTVAPDTGDCTYLLSMNQKIFETDIELRRIRTFRAPGFKHAWMAHRLESGQTLVSAGYGAFMALFDQRGRLIRSFGGLKNVPVEVNPFFYASFGIAENGNLLVANWQGHGADMGHSGRQLLCFNSDGDYLESWSFPGISSLQGLLLI